MTDKEHLHFLRAAAEADHIEVVVVKGVGARDEVLEGLGRPPALLVEPPDEGVRRVAGAVEAAVRPGGLVVPDVAAAAAVH